MDSILEACSKFLKRKVYICNQLLLETSSVHHLPILPISWRLAPRPLASSQSHRQTARNGTCHECSANFSGSSGTSPEPLLNDRVFSPVTTHFTIWSSQQKWQAGKRLRKVRFCLWSWKEWSFSGQPYIFFLLDPLAERTKVFILKICQNVMKTWTQIISPLTTVGGGEVSSFQFILDAFLTNPTSSVCKGTTSFNAGDSNSRKPFTLHRLCVWPQRKMESEDQWGAATVATWS